MTSNYKPEDYKNHVKPSWCPGCGHYAVFNAMLNAFSTLGIPPENIVVASGIGCSSRIPYFCKTYGFHSVHGRALPLSIGIKSTNPKLRVVVAGGDGDGFSIGGNHILHASRKNPDMTYIVMDNAIYGLTKGQNSPTSPVQMHTKVNPYENLDEKLNPVLVALGNNTSYIARGHSADPKQLTELVIEGMEHRGFSFLHIMSPCVQYNTEVTYESLKKAMRPLPEDHNRQDRAAAVYLALQKVPLYSGVFYKNERPTLTDKLNEVRHVAKRKVSPKIGEKEMRKLQDMMEQFK
ncbi:MAG: 2-oxoacid:ferredoxin oxidoreductase subunit beta [Vampirovibrionia bacterium]